MVCYELWLTLVDNYGMPSIIECMHNLDGFSRLLVLLEFLDYLLVESYHLSDYHLELLFIKLMHWMRIKCSDLQDSSFLSSYGDGAITSSFVESLVFLHVLHLCFCKPCVDFCSCEGDNNRDGLKTLGVCTFTNFEFVGVAWA